MRRVALAGAGLYLVFIFRLLLQLDEVGVGDGVTDSAVIFSALHGFLFVCAAQLLGGHAVAKSDEVNARHKPSKKQNRQYCV